MFQARSGCLYVVPSPQRSTIYPVYPCPPFSTTWSSQPGSDARCPPHSAGFSPPHQLLVLQPFPLLKMLCVLPISWCHSPLSPYLQGGAFPVNPPPAARVPPLLESIAKIPSPVARPKHLSQECSLLSQERTHCPPVVLLSIHVFDK